MEFERNYIEKTFRNNGMEGTLVGEWLMMKCPFHEENVASFGVNITHGGFNCFGCGEKGNFQQLIEKLKLVIDASDIIDSKSNLDVLKRIKEKSIKESKEFLSIKKIFVPFYKSVNNSYSKRIYQYALERKISKKAIMELKLGYVESGRFLNRLIFPVFDVKGELSFFEGRSVISDGKNKYIRSKGSKSKKILYNIHNVQKNNYVILVEGVMDTAVLHGWGLPSVCCFGAGLSEEQLLQLITFDKVYICLDRDEAGMKGIQQIKTLLKKECFTNFFLIKLPLKIDVADKRMDKRRFLEIKRKAKRLFIKD